MITIETREVLRSGAVKVVGTYGIRVGFKVSDKGKFSHVYATFRANTGSMTREEYLASDPKDKQGNPLLFALKTPKQEEGVWMEKLAYAYTAAGLLALAEKMEKIDFVALATKLD